MNLQPGDLIRFWFGKRNVNNRWVEVRGVVDDVAVVVRPVSGPSGRPTGGAAARLYEVLTVRFIEIAAEQGCVKLRRAG